MSDDKKCIIYTARGLDSKIASAIACKMMEKYFLVYTLYMGNGFDDIPMDLWNYHQLVMIGVSPNEMGMRTIRSLIHDKNIVWLDNNTRNIPMWTDFSMLPGDRDPQKTLTELAWRFYHDMEDPPESLKLMIGNKSVHQITDML